MARSREVKVLIRILALTAIAVFIAVRTWACLTGLAYFVGLSGGLIIAAALLWLRLFWLLQLAILFATIALWHLPIVLAVLLAVPRVVLMLPGLVSTYLASRRHPRARWSP